jgi:mannose-6-phosphate isomerase-like protein (cupin superfamily)
MSTSDDSVVIVAAENIAAEDKADKSIPPKDYHRQPLEMFVPILRETDSVIESPDSAVAAVRGIPVTEAIRSGIVVIGPNGGEVWHTHPDFVDTVLYVAEGKATFSWRNGDDEKRQDVGSGDFVFIRPGSTHQWLNTGDADLRLVFFQHTHDYGN